MYETLPQRALADMPVADVIDALRSFPTDARIAVGAVWYLCRWKSRNHQEHDIPRLPAELRARLLAVVRESGDDDKRRRAERLLSSWAE